MLPFVRAQENEPCLTQKAMRREKKNEHTKKMNEEKPSGWSHRLWLVYDLNIQTRASISACILVPISPDLVVLPLWP